VLTLEVCILKSVYSYLGLTKLNHVAGNHLKKVWYIGLGCIYIVIFFTMTVNVVVFFWGGGGSGKKSENKI